MKDLSLREQIIKRFRQRWKDGQNGFINSGAVEKWAIQFTKKPSNAGRRLRELCEEGLLERTEMPLNDSHIKSVYYRYIPSRHEQLSANMKQV